MKSRGYILFQRIMMGMLQHLVAASILIIFAAILFHSNLTVITMEGQKTFRACVSVAGRMTSLVWKNSNKKNKVGFFQISGEKDDIVPKNSDGRARHTVDPAIEDVVDYWAGSNGLTVVEEEEIAGGSSLTKWSSKGASAKGQVWHLFVKDGRHSWPNVRMNGIDANTMILDFFDCF